MTIQDLVKIIKENFTNEYGVVDISGMDFGNTFVCINELKTKESLFQESQEVGGDLYQDCQKVGGDLHQDCQKVGGNLEQHNQEVKGNIFQGHSIVNGIIFQNDQKAKEVKS